MNDIKERWPELRHDAWTETLRTLHLWTQIVGKIRLMQEPLVNHWWNVTLYVTPRGLTTSTMPYGHGRSFMIDFDFVDHQLRIDGCDGEQSAVSLEPMSVAAFYERVMRELNSLGFDVRINKKPNEITDAIPFDRDTAHASYDPAAVERFWRALIQADRLLKAFRARFVGKSSPVHFFWGSFDLAVSRFSGRRAPPHPGGFPNLSDSATREAYSHEEFSAGFWPGGNGFEPSFYAYAYPEPAGLSRSPVRADAGHWNTQLKEFLLPYEAVRMAPDPDSAVLEFLQSTYEAAANLGAWDRATLERPLFHQP